MAGDGVEGEVTEMCDDVHVWSARPRAAMASVARLAAMFVGFGAMMFIATGWGDTGAPVETSRRIMLAAVIAGLGVVVVLALLLGGAREVRASAEGLVVRSWLFGAYQVPRERIRGVRTYRHRPAVEVVVANGANLYLSGADSLKPWDGAMSRVLVGLFGQHDDDARYEARATQADVVERACGTAEFCVRERSEVYRWHGLLSLILIGLGILQWNRVFQWLTEYEVRGDSDWVLLTFGVLAVAAFLLLGLFEAWIWFAHNRVEGVTVSERGIVVRKRRGELVMAAGEIDGVQVRRSPASRSPMIWVHLRSGRVWGLRESLWLAEPGEVAGVLLHRFGEWVPRVRDERKPA